MNVLRLAARWLLLPLLLCITCIGAALAEQKLTVDEGGSYQITVSAHELTRIAVEGGRILAAKAVSTDWQIDADKKVGELYLTERSLAAHPFSFMVRDSFGNTYTLIAMPSELPSQTVVLQSVRHHKAAADLSDQPYVDQIKSILKDMVRKQYDSYTCAASGADVPLWQEAKVTLSQECDNGTLQVDVYTLVNVSPKQMVLDEQEFRGFGDRVQAVAIEHLVLPAGQGTALYVVRGME